MKRDPLLPESFLPLSISALLAIVLHASILLWYGLLPAQSANAAATSQPIAKPILPDPIPKPQPPEPKEPPKTPEPEKPEPPKPEPEPEPEPEPKPEPAAAQAPQPKPLEIGRDGEPVRSTIAWIPYDDFKKLMAPESLTIQPALQTQADPVAGAPVEINPSAAKPTPATILTHSRTQQDEQTEQAEQAQQPEQPTQPQQQEQPPSAEPEPTDVAAADAPADQAPDQSSVDAAKPVDLATSPVTPPAAPTDAASASTATSADAAETADANTKTSDESSAKPPAGMTIAAGRDLPEVTPQPDHTAEIPAVPQADADQASTAKPAQPPIKQPTDQPLEQPPAKSAKQPTPQDDRLALAPLKNVDPVQPSANEPPATQPVKPSEAASPAKPTKPAQEAQPARSAATASESNEDRPTSVPRADRESIATQNTPMPDQIVLGKVLVSDGIEIKTVRPRFNISTLFTATPRNPIATIIFDKTGQVVRAELVISSGFADIDSPILNSLYRWRASGKKLENLQSDTFTIRHMKLLLVDDRKSKESDASSQDESGD